MQQPPTPVELSQLIGLIYDCAVDPARWGPTLTEIHRALGFATATLSLLELPSGRVLLQITSGIDAAWLERMPDYEAAVLDLWGGPAAIDSYPLDRAAVVSRVNPAALREPMNAYARDWALPQGLVDSLAIPLARDGSAIGSIAMGRHRDAGPISDRDVAMAQLLLPHLQRAAAINRLLDARQTATDRFASILDALSAPMLLVTASREILYANPAARAVLDAGRLLAARGNVLFAVPPGSGNALVRAVAGEDLSQGENGPSSHVIPIRADGEVHALHVLTLRAFRGSLGLVASAAAAIVVGSPQRPPEGASRIAAAVFNLTPAEERVLDGLCTGQTPARLARTLNVAPSTVRTHLLRLFEKTGVHRQLELVQLATSMITPLAAPTPGVVREPWDEKGATRDQGPQP